VYSMVKQPSRTSAKRRIPLRVLDDFTGMKHTNEALQQLAAILDSSDDAIYARNLAHKIISWNRGAERMFGYTAEEAVGQDVHLLIPEDRRGEAQELIDKVSRGERIERYKTVRARRDGNRIEVALTASPLRDSAGETSGALIIARDISEQKRSRRALRELESAKDNRTVILDTANRVALDILASQTGVEALRHIAEAARQLAGAQYAALGVARPDGQGLIEFVTVGLTPEQEAAIGPRPSGLGVLGVLLQRKEPLRIGRLANHPQSVGFPPNHPSMDSFLGVPIRRGNIVLGSLYLTNKEGGGDFTEEDELAVEALGAYSAVAVYNLQMLSRQRSLVSGLIAAQEEERRAVAYDLHDGLTQYVMASHAHLEAFKRAHQTGNEERADRELSQGLSYLKDAVIESRRLVNGLRLLALDDLGLAGALEQLLHEEKERAGWQNAEFAHNVADRRFDKSLETAVYRIAQEALTNSRKHAESDLVRLTLLERQEPHAKSSTLTLEVRDWGKGFVPENKIGEEGRVGLQGIVERANLLGAEHEIQSKPGGGAMVKAVFPVLEEQKELR